MLTRANIGTASLEAQYPTDGPRRVSGTQGAPPAVRFVAEDLEIDLEAHRVIRSAEEVRLTKTEWSLLEELSRHPGKLLTHNWLLEHVWGPGYTGDVDILRVFISQLRRKIEPDPARPRIIATDPGIGVPVAPSARG